MVVFVIDDHPLIVEALAQLLPQAVRLASGLAIPQASLLPISVRSIDAWRVLTELDAARPRPKR
jgi:hypothetical protein